VRRCTTPTPLRLTACRKSAAPAARARLLRSGAHPCPHHVVDDPGLETLCRCSGTLHGVRGSRKVGEHRGASTASDHGSLWSVQAPVDGGRCCTAGRGGSAGGSPQQQRRPGCARPAAAPPISARCAAGSLCGCDRGLAAGRLLVGRAGHSAGQPCSGWRPPEGAPIGQWRRHQVSWAAQCPSVAHQCPPLFLGDTHM
jgi:hypothetical protein